MEKMYMLLGLVILALHVDAAPKKHTFSIVTVPLYGQPDPKGAQFFIKVIMDYGDSRWFWIPVVQTTRLRAVQVEYVDSEKDVYGVIRGFVAEYCPKTDSGSPKSWTMKRMQVGTYDYSEYPNEVPSCIFGMLSLVKDKRVACMYNRDGNEHDKKMIAKVKREQPAGTLVYASELDYMKAIGHIGVLN